MPLQDANPTPSFGGFGLRPQSGENETLVTRLGHPLLEVSDGEHYGGEERQTGG